MSYAWLITLGSTWLLYFSGVFVLLTPLPLLYRFATEGRRAFLKYTLFALLGVIIVYGLLLSIGDGGARHWPVFVALPGFGFLEFLGAPFVLGFGVFYFFYFVVMAYALGFADERRLSVEASFALAVITPILIELLAMVFIYFLLDFNLIAQMKGYLLSVIDKVTQSEQTVGLKAEDLRYLAQNKETIVAQMIRMSPAGIVLATLITVWCNIIVAKVGFLKAHEAGRKTLFEHFGSLADWRLSEKYIWGLIGAGALYFINVYGGAFLGSGLSRVLGWLAINGLWIMGALYFLQGAAIVAHFIQRRSSFFLKIAIYGLMIVFFHISALFMAVLGILDIWFDFRKRQKPQDAGSA